MAPLTRINSPALPIIRSPLSHATQVGGLLFVSGMPPYHGERAFAVDDFDAQFRQVMVNLVAVLEAGGSSISSVVKTTVILTKRDMFEDMNRLYREHFVAPYPARTTVVADLGIDGMLLEIECVAQIERAAS
ncbi:MAG: RidA family protein [Alphaproteobacteria bacterium]